MTTDPSPFRSPYDKDIKSVRRVFPFVAKGKLMIDRGIELASSQMSTDSFKKLGIASVVFHLWHLGVHRDKSRT